MIKCLTKKRTYQTLLASWNETKVAPEAVEKEYSVLENYMRTIKSSFERVTKEYEEAKSKFGDVSIEKLLAEKDGKELGGRFDADYNYAKCGMLKIARWYNKGKLESEEAESILKRYNEEKEKCQIAEEKAKRELGQYLIQYTYELLAEREKTKEELKLFIEECEEKFGCWYDINEAKDYEDAKFCKCVFCGNSNSKIPWHKKNYVSKTYLSRGWTNEHQEALNKINSMEETLKEIQELLEIICFAKEKHEYGEKHYGFMGCSHYECKICGYKEYIDDGEDW